MLKPGGLFSTSDPITPMPLPPAFAADARLRARCLSGCLTLTDYLAALTSAGCGRIEVRAKVPYRYLHPREYPALAEPVLLESIEVAAYKVPDGPDGPMVFTGRTAIYAGPELSWEDGRGILLRQGMPMPVSDGAAARLAGQPEIVLTGPTYHAKGGGCC